MKTYEVEVDVHNTYRATIKASDEEQAARLVLKLAYQDTWGCTATHGGSEVYSIEEIEHEAEYEE